MHILQIHVPQCIYYEKYFKQRNNENLKVGKKLFFVKYFLLHYYFYLFILS